MGRIGAVTGCGGVSGAVEGDKESASLLKSDMGDSGQDNVGTLLETGGFSVKNCGKAELAPILVPKGSRKVAVPTTCEASGAVKFATRLS